jgi:hypothetical protein
MTNNDEPTELEAAFRACSRAKGNKYARGLVKSVGGADFLADVPASKTAALLAAFNDGVAKTSSAERRTPPINTDDLYTRAYARWNNPPSSDNDDD